MEKVYLVVTKVNEGHYSDTKVEKYSSERDTLTNVARLVAGNFGIHESDQKLDKILEVDITYGTLKELEVGLESNRLKLRVVKEAKL